MSKRYYPLSKISGIALVLAYIITSTNGEICPCCIGKPDGWRFEDPLDCHGYYVCRNQQSYQEYCSNLEKFDEKTQKCVIGKCPPCHQCPGTPSPTPSPNDCYGYPHGSIMRDNGDCAKYYVCSWGKVTAHTCREGFHFNNEIKACDYRENVDCDASTPPTPNPSPATPSPATPSPATPSPATPSPATPSPATPSPATPSPATPSPATPAPSGDCNGRPHGAMWRDPNDCSQFYVCSWGIITLHKCPSGLHFNTKLNVCDYPINVDCNNGGTPSPATPSPATPSPATPSPATPSPATPSPATPSPATPSPATPSPATPSPATPSPATPSPATPSPATPSPATPSPATPSPATPSPATPSPATPAPSGDCNGRLHGDMWRDPNDCSQFYVCSWGVVTLHKCPSGLHFNTKLNVCDYPANVDCNNGGTPSPTTPSPATPSPATPSPATPSPATPSPATPSPATPSPATPSPATPSPATPSQATPSPATPSPATPSPATPSPATPSPSTPTPTTPTPCITPSPTPSTPGTSNECEGKKDNDLISDPTDCAGYFLCYKGMKIPKKCPSGMYFLQSLEACLPSDQVQCTTATPGTVTTTRTTKTTTSRTTTTKSPTTSATKPPCGVCDNPCTGETGYVLYRDPTDCAKVVICNKGTPINYRCPDGQFFDLVVGSCMNSKQVDCVPVRSTTTASPPSNSCDGQSNKIYRDPNNCSKVNYCNKGILKTYECPSGKYYDMNLGTCLAQNLVDCKMSPTSNPTTPSPSENNPFNPCDASTGYALFRDPANCARVYIFKKGNLIVHECSNGKSFDLTISACVNSALVDC